ncbi:MAG: peptidyl-prolyl cis-trans isomerase [Alphaproteobacteria bacterium]|nr:peptidyl-prolyl cis-trans isomerase [Alphaproteobacteria bacterium]USO07755.1 MAG: peptidyl-prolyl cis-trans isomerase [Rhodospirillales bacterium]
MLNSFREGQSAAIIKYVALGFVLLASLGMVFMDVGGFFRNGIIADTTLARVGRTKIDQAAFERNAREALRAQNMTLQEAYRFGLLGNLLEEMVTREALRQEAAREGLIVSRKEIAKRVAELIRPQVQPGETPETTLRRILQAQGLSEADLVASLRQDTTSRLMQSPLAAAGYYLPALAAEAMGRYQNERRDIEFFTLTPENAGADIKPDDAALKAYYETLKDQYQIPEERSFKAIVISADDIRKTVSVNDDDLKKAYAERKDQFQQGERRKIEQLVLPDEAKAKAAVEAARKGKPLKSIDTAAYRPAMETDQGALPPELGAPVFAAKKGDVLNPVKSPLGWHVIKVLGITQPRGESFAEVQGTLRKELESDAVRSEMETRVSRADELLGSGESLDDVAKEMDLPVRTVGPINQKGTVSKSAASDPLLTALAGNRDVLAGLFELMEGETGDLSEVDDNTYAAFSLESVRPTRDRDFAEVRDEIAKKWLADQRTQALNAQVEKLAGAVSRGEIDFAQAAKQAGVVVKTARDVSRKSKVAGLNDPVALSRLFDETDFNAVVRVPTGGDVILAKVLSARIPEAGTGTLTQDEVKQLRTRMQQAVIGLFMADLRKRNGVNINEKNLERMYGADSTDQGQ